jgi:hypothetical protein
VPLATRRSSLCRTTTSTDGYSKEITAIMGVNTDDGRGNLTAWLGYRNNDAVLQGSRDYSACASGIESAAAAADAGRTLRDFTCGGSSTSYPGRYHGLRRVRLLARPRQPASSFAILMAQPTSTTSVR